MPIPRALYQKKTDVELRTLRSQRYLRLLHIHEHSQGAYFMKREGEMLRESIQAIDAELECRRLQPKLP